MKSWCEHRYHRQYKRSMESNGEITNGQKVSNCRLKLECEQLSPALTQTSFSNALIAAEWSKMVCRETNRTQNANKTH